jgi:hypothetical protein
MVRHGYIDCKIELIENSPCNNAEELKNKKRNIWEINQKINNK